MKHIQLCPPVGNGLADAKRHSQQKTMFRALLGPKNGRNARRRRSAVTGTSIALLLVQTFWNAGRGCDIAVYVQR